MNLIQKIEEEYKPNETIWNEDDEDMTLLKKSLMKLNESDRIIMLLYAETQSLIEVGKMLGVSDTIIFKEIKRIKKEMYDIFKLNCTNSNSVLLGRFERICGVC